MLKSLITDNLTITTIS